MKDPEGRRTVRDIVESEPFRMVPIGRLDFASEGALLLTTDGELAHHLMHPSYKAPKVYVVKVGGQPSDAKLDQLRKGVRLEDGRTRPAVIDVVKQDETHTWLEFVLTEGKNRQIRRMCDAIGHRAFRVYRTEFAGVSVDGLRPGQFRYLTAAELARLYETVSLSEIVPPLSARAIELGGKPEGAAERRKGILPGESRSEHRMETKPRAGGGRPNTRRKARAQPKDEAAKPGRSSKGRAPPRSKGGPKPTETGPRKPVGVKPSDYRKQRGPGSR
jgi:23S rRNA pseudouridine2605 synthase